MIVILALVFGLFTDPSVLVDKYFVRISDPVDLPDMTRWSPPGPSGARSSMFMTGKFGWHPWRCDASGKPSVDAVIERLGPPMELARIGRTERGYMWRHRDPAKPHAGLMVILHKRGVELRGWSEIDLARGYSGRLNVIAQENEIYRWFDWLTEPLTPGEAASPPAVAPTPDGDVAR